MATSKFNLPLNAVESIKYALIQVFNSFYQSIFPLYRRQYLICMVPLSLYALNLMMNLIILPCFKVT